ncbi:MAG TPA: AzlD domain-containing protein [Anaeromyxobacter sp.]|nr:AzlD domain-containing protein [Anaeromyxobacter sp.]
MSFWMVMIAGGLVTYLTRLSFIAAEGRLSVPRWFRAMLPFVPIATLTALIAPELLRPGGEWAVSLKNPRLVAGAVAIVTAALARNVLLTIALGFLVFLGLVWLGATPTP